MDEEKKKELFPFFAYLYSQQMNPEKYGKVTSMDEWIELIQEDEEDVKKVTEAAKKLTDEEWDLLDKQYAEIQSKESSVETSLFAKKGAVLKILKEQKVSKQISLPTFKVGGKIKKCSCGCNLVLSKGTGGKLTESCACKCGGKIKKKK